MGKAGCLLKLAACLLCLAWALLRPGFAGAVTPSAEYASEPGSLGLIFESVHFPSVRDSLALQGWWFPSAEPGPVVVLFPRGRGNMADLLPSVREFARRGLAVLAFDARDFGPGGAGATDSLRDVIFASRWVDDGEGAVRYARSRAAGRAVFAWGQELGASLAVAVAGRHRETLDGIAIEGVFRTTVEQLGWLGLSQDPMVLRQHRILVDLRDEPIAAASRSRVPVFAVLAGKDEVTPASTTEMILAANHTNTTRWPLPAAVHAGIEQTPGYYDRITDWIKLRARVTPLRPH